MSEPAIERPVEGDLLSCYTTSIAEYIEGNGIDHQLAMGAQLVPRRPTETADQQALGWVVSAPGPGEIAWHGGATGGYRCFLLLDRSRVLADAVGAGRAAVVGLSYRLADGSAHLITRT